MKRVCIQCKKEFEISEQENQYYKKQGLQLPKRCKECREANKKDTLQVICVECGKVFPVTKGERDYYRSKGFKMPKRCSECRGMPNIGLRKNRYFEGIQTYGLNIPALRNRDSGVVETNIPDTETAFDWLDCHS